MSKRSFPWEEDVGRQSKQHLTDRMFNENNPDYMNEVYARTNTLLFEGARKAITHPQEMCVADENGHTVEAEALDDSFGMDVDNSQELQMGHRTLERLAKTDKRDPSPRPLSASSAQNPMRYRQLTISGFIEPTIPSSTRRACPTSAASASQAIPSSAARVRFSQEEPVVHVVECEMKGPDENGNKKMEQ